jgi:hypothetical protein
MTDVVDRYAPRGSSNGLSGLSIGSLSLHKHIVNGNCCLDGLQYVLMGYESNRFRQLAVLFSLDFSCSQRVAGRVTLQRRSKNVRSRILPISLKECKACLIINPRKDYWTLTPDDHVLGKEPGELAWLRDPVGIFSRSRAVSSGRV